MIPKEMVSTSLKKVGRFKESVQTVPIVQNVPTASFLILGLLQIVIEETIVM